MAEKPNPYTETGVLRAILFGKSGISLDDSRKSAYFRLLKQNNDDVRIGIKGISGERILEWIRKGDPQGTLLKRIHLDFLRNRKKAFAIYPMREEIKRYKTQFLETGELSSEIELFGNDYVDKITNANVVGNKVQFTLSSLISRQSVLSLSADVFTPEVKELLLTELSKHREHVTRFNEVKFITVSDGPFIKIVQYDFDSHDITVSMDTFQSSDKGGELEHIELQEIASKAIRQTLAAVEPTLGSETLSQSIAATGAIDNTIRKAFTRLEDSDIIVIACGTAMRNSDPQALPEYYQGKYHTLALYTLKAKVLEYYLSHQTFLGFGAENSDLFIPHSGRIFRVIQPDQDGSVAQTVGGRYLVYYLRASTDFDADKSKYNIPGQPLILSGVSVYFDDDTKILRVENQHASAADNATILAKIHRILKEHRDSGQ